MSVGNALTASISGLRTAQAGMALVGQNVANADNPTYTRKTLVNQTKVIGEQVVGVRSTQAQRTLDTLLQGTLRTELAGGAYTDMRAQYAERLEALYGIPGTDTALDATFNAFVTSLQALTTSPENPIAQSRAVAEAGVLSQRISGIANDIQALRLEAEQGLADSVARMNDALMRISEIDKQIIASSGGGRTPVNLLDQRDAAIGELAKLMDLRVDVNADNSVAVFTRSGVLLYDREPAVLDFDQRAAITPQNAYSTDPARRTVGTITMRTPNGLSIDLIAQGAFRSGEVAALISIRDDMLVDAQAQLDEFAAGLALSLSERSVTALSDFTAPANAATASNTVAVAPVTGGRGISLPDLTPAEPLQPGDRFTLDITVGGVARKVTIVRNDTAPAVPGWQALAGSSTEIQGDIVLGVAFGASMADFAANATAALQGTPGVGANFSAAWSAGPPRVLQFTAAGADTVNALTARLTESRTNGGQAAFAFFVDQGGTRPTFSDSLDGAIRQKVGFSQRLAVNPELMNAPDRLVLMSATTLSGDPTRPNAIMDRLTKATRVFTGVDGIGSEQAPTSATVVSYMKRIVTAQGQQAETEKRLAEGQKIVVNSLQDRFDAGARVNVDEEMARLIELQQTYQASARIISAVDEMMRVLLQS